MKSLAQGHIDLALISNRLPPCCLERGVRVRWLSLDLPYLTMTKLEGHILLLLDASIGKTFELLCGYGLEWGSKQEYST
jgi:hypothetical protein